MLFIIGILAGIISGMGIGGGTILIPALTIFMSIDQKTAQAINLVYFIPTATAALVGHIKNKRIEKRGLLYIIIFGIIGAFIGSFFAIKVKSPLLKKAFGWFLCVMGVLEIFKGFNLKNK